MKITENFDSSEIKCPCCDDTNIRLKTVELAQAIRDELKQPVYVPEGGGKRCSAYQDTIGDYVSAHESGDAIDLYIKPYKLANMLTIAHLGKELGATRIGLYPEYHVKSVHLDLFPIIKSESWVRTIKRGYIYFKHFESAVKYVKENYL